MKQNRLYGLATALLLSTALTAPAKADFDVLAVILKDKNVTVTEDIHITKVFRFEADVQPEVDATAEALTVANQRIQRNRLDAFDDVSNGSWIINSINGNKGVTAVNQDSGNASNQGNVGSFAMVNDGDVFANAEVSAEQINGREVFPVLTDAGVSGWELSSPADANLTFFANVSTYARMSSSMNGNVGITHVNQNAGDLNNQLNALAIGAGIGDSVNGFALAEADLGQETADANVFDFSVDRLATIDHSGSNNQGIVGFNQSAGLMGNQANLAAVSAALIGQ